MARRVPKGQQTRGLILDVALRQFAERGYRAVTIEEIAAAASVSKGAVYHWFADKDDIGREVQHDLYQRLAASAAGAIAPDADIVDTMAKAFHAYLDALGNLGEARFFLRDAWTIPELDGAGRADHDAAVDSVRHALARGVARGEIVDVDPEVLARVLMGAWAEATLHVLRTGHRDAAIDVIEHLTDGLRPRAPAPTAEKKDRAR